MPAGSGKAAPRVCSDKLPSCSLIGRSFLRPPWVPVSTTHTITSGVMGAGSVYRTSAVRWEVARGSSWPGSSLSRPRPSSQHSRTGSAPPCSGDLWHAAGGPERVEAVHDDRTGELFLLSAHLPN